MTELKTPSAALAIERAVDALPYVPPTRGRRSALARIFWRAAMTVRASSLPNDAKRAIRDAYLARVKLLRANGEFDSEAYDRAAGLRHAFVIEWWANAHLCQGSTSESRSSDASCRAATNLIP
jgi:hypothetical protein